MRKYRLAAVLLVPLLALVFVWTRSGAQETPKNTHSDYYEHYEGTKTCLKCHEKDAENFFHSQHYQWRGETPKLVNANGRKLGKINTFNDFCTSPTGNWIGFVKNSRGEVISRGCSTCHAGNGLKPSETMSREQLENIDCLICHASGYRRDLYQNEKGDLLWKPILWKNQEGLDSVSKRISKPTRVMCLRCHSASGGGPNFKRGDIEYKLADPDRSYDVHMASEGKNMQCVACHAGENHRVLGRGADLAGSDTIGKDLTCESTACHSAPHKNPVLNRHSASLNCTVCHIPRFARTDATDMVRDWSKPSYNAEADKYSATITLQKDVTPVYAWFNGFTKAQLLGEPANFLPDGSVGIMIPQGSRDDPKAKIYAFKLHKARLPLLADKNWLIPITVEHFFSSGQIDPAVQMAAKEMYDLSTIKYTWVETTRYMGIFHGVQPKEQALKCMDCHGPKGVMDWKALGYKGNPMSLKPPPRKN
ncbi:MAG: hypothetical protein JSS81_14585 [Acidobacteria bacterium]|nr:hypothetical protein [Acidobacteriota bacterium]